MTSVKSKGATAPRSSSSNRKNSDYPWLKVYPKSVDWNAKLTPQPLGEMLDDAVAEFGERKCTYFLGESLTYAEIGALSDRLACGLQQLGVKKGVHVGLLLPNTPTYVAFYFAILKAGGTVVNYNPLYTVEELEEQVEDSETKILVTLDLKLLFDKTDALLTKGILEKAIVASFAGLLPTIKSFLFRTLKAKELSNPAASVHAGRIVFERDLTANDGRYEKSDIEPLSDVAVLQYTGGTTGTPKGAMLTHANLTSNVQQIQDWTTNLDIGTERVMGILPFFHVFAMTTVLNFGISMGGELILMPRFELSDALKLIKKQKVTVLPGVPTLYNAMLHHPKLKPDDLSSLKFCISGGAPLPIEVKRGFEAASNCSLVEGYGLSETSPVATCNPVEGSAKEGSIGIPVPQTIISIRAIDNPKKELGIGEDGEICIAGPQVMAGYWNKPEETKDTFVGEYFKTGDVGHMDDEGFTFIIDRLKDMINASGFKIYPRRIEEAIYQHPCVEEVTVVGIPDEYRGEAPKAFIKLKQGKAVTDDEILDFLKPKISKIEMPSQIEFRDELPKTMVGKLSKKELRQRQPG
jgi:long-chain acyl-CoA synthetase